jgi:integrase
MSVKLTQGNFLSVMPKGKSPWITDSEMRGLRLYIAKDGRRTWYIYYEADGKRNKSYKLGAAEVLTVGQAREMARDFLARITRGERPFEKSVRIPTLGEYLDGIYSLRLATIKTGARVLKELKSEFAPFLRVRLDLITVSDILKWETKRKSGNDPAIGVKNVTINHFISYLKTALNHAVDIGLIEKSPLERLKFLKASDAATIERYLTDDEYIRLIRALDTPGIPAFMKPLVVLALNSGIRRNGLLSLTWEDIDLEAKTIIIRSQNSKSGKQINLPLNNAACSALAAWKLETGNPASKELVFKSPKTGKKRHHFGGAWEKLRKVASLENFRWHDTRHHYASRLVMSGVDLATVQKLCGHSSISMTARYAHLAPEGLRKAVNILSDVHEEILQKAKNI